MTESEWLSCTDPREMDEFLYHLQTGRTGGLLGHMREQKWKLIPPRKWVLAACAYCRKLSRLTNWTDLAPCVELAEQREGGKAGLTVSNEAYAIFGEVQERCMFGIYDGQAEADELEETANDVYQSWCDLLREIFGNPFRPASINRAWLAWNDGTVGLVAHAAYDDNAFDLLPVLADALEDAGCDDENILRHCRGEGPHVRGCWVTDLILGRD